ncbi:ABC-three component system middle component 5 [Aureivirga sp. CE67]|uniref:ABC-three component system middle component 5 n=1 Tax=Aureivirga sp. CE67 TaxID=1788983 RepID=UPI001E3CD76F|nr:ABC-three component system middle component 5 [Aureivirga sp. CE67]
MIIYHQAFDLYHTVYRMIQLLGYFKRGDQIEIDRLRIWDYYMLFPNKLSNLKLRRNEKDIKNLINSFIIRADNPYEEVIDDRKMFEKIKPYQMTAIKSLASYGIVNKDYLTTNRINSISSELIEDYISKLEKLTNQEENTIKLLTSHFYQMSLYGEYGLKDRSKLLESKYDAQ